MLRSIGETKVRFTAGSCIFAALLLLVLPLQWVIAAAFAAGFHEFCHGCAVHLTGGRVYGVTFGIGGVSMEVGSMSPGRELCCALAGPFGGLLLLLFARWIPRIAICAGVQSLYNLLPVYPLDGGRALRCGVEMLLPGWSDRICGFLEKICCAGLVLLSLYGLICLRLGPVPLLFTVALLLKQKNTLQTR